MNKLILLDANILIRGLLGEQVPRLLAQYSEHVQFFTTTTCYAEVKLHLPAILQKRGLVPELFLDALDTLDKVVLPLGEEIYSEFEVAAKQRIAERDLRDWPLLALALALECPIWTEDNDFFGTGVATWRTQNVEIYLRG